MHKSKSVGALVASLNQSLTRFISSANLHDSPNSELDNTMKPAVMKALRKYRDVNGCLPERIIMYRSVLLQYLCSSQFLIILLSGMAWVMVRFPT